MEQKKKKKHSENLRLVVMNEDTFKEKYSFSLNLRNTYILVSSVVLILFLIIFSLISYTPMKYLVPGYGDIENNSYVLKLNQYINTLESQMEIQEQYNVSLRKIILGNDTSVLVNNNNLNSIEGKRNNVKHPSKNENDTSQIKIKNSPIKSPLEGKIVKKIDISSSHYGIDISGFKNSPIKSVLNGVVLFSDWSTETGNTIIVQHPNGMTSVYKHNSSLLKEIGDFVKQGEAIAIIGNTGTLTDGPHLHFELWKNGIPINPLNYIEVDNN